MNPGNGIETIQEIYSSSAGFGFLIYESRQRD